MARPGELEVTLDELSEGVVLVRIDGELDMATTSRLETALSDAGPGRRVVVDLTDCRFLDSSAVRVLLAGASTVEAAGGSVSLVAPDPGIRRVLEIAGVGTTLSIDTTLDAAL